LFQSYRFRTKDEFPLDQLNFLKNLRIVTLRLPWYKAVEATRAIPFGYLIHYLLFPFFTTLRRLLNYNIHVILKLSILGVGLSRSIMTLKFLEMTQSWNAFIRHSWKSATGSL
jgi:hypothetical protein